MTNQYAILETVVDEQFEATNSFGVARHVDAWLEVVVRAFCSEEIELDVRAFRR